MDSSVIWMLPLGLVLLIAGAELFIRSAARLALSLGMSRLTVGLTVVAIGTSAPEIASSISAALKGQADIALGNVVGSNIMNLLLILGAVALISPLIVARKLVHLEIPVLIGASVLCAGMAWDGFVSYWEGAGLLTALIFYLLLSLGLSRQGPMSEQPRDRGPFTGAQESPQRSRSGSALQFFLGLTLLVIGAGWLVEGSAGLARALGVSELVIGLTIVAAGTSLPEAATSILAALRNERDIAVGNLLGSSIVNLLGVLGATSVVASNGIAVSSAARNFDIPVMVGAAILCLPIFITGAVVRRWEGGLLLGFYIAYIAVLIAGSMGHLVLPSDGWILAGIGLALTLPLFAGNLFRHFQITRRKLPHTLTSTIGAES